MLKIRNLREQSFLVYGLGLTARSVINFFKKKNFLNFKVYDDKEKKQEKVGKRIKKDDQDSRVKHIFLNSKGEKIFNEIFEIQKKRIYNALLSSNSEEVINFDNVLKKIING